MAIFMHNALRFKKIIFEEESFMRGAKPVFSAVAAAVLLLACNGPGTDGPENPNPPPSGQAEPPAPEEPKPEESKPDTPVAVVLPVCGKDKVPVSDRIAPCANLPEPGKTKTLAIGEMAPQALSAPNLTATVQLPPLPAEETKKIQKQDSMPLQDDDSVPPGWMLLRSEPMAIGVTRDVPQVASPAGFQALLHWQPTAAGGYVAALRFVSPSARAVSLEVWVQALPPGSVLRTYDDTRQKVEQITQEALQEKALSWADTDLTEQIKHTWRSSNFGGDSITLEVEIPPGADPGQVRIAVPGLAHFVMSVEQADDLLYAKEANIGRGGSCQTNAVCSLETDLESRATARMVFMKEDKKHYLCTGTLLNDSDNSGKPWFLTARHCINSKERASSLRTYWLFRSRDCKTDKFDPKNEMVILKGGAEYLESDKDLDIALLLLKDTPPPGVAFAGSYFGNSLEIGQNVLGVHHPLGDLQKIGRSTLEGFRNCRPAGDRYHRCSRYTVEDGKFRSVTSKNGSMQHGSSGSALFAQLDGIHYVIGSLSGGNNTCQDPNASPITYGRFDLAYPKLKQWLNPKG